MLAVRQRLGVLDVAFTVALAIMHATMSVAYLVPGLAVGVYAATPGRVSVVSRLDQYGPVWQIGFGATAIFLGVAAFRVHLLPAAHGVSAGASSIYAAALWLGFALSDPRPSIVTAFGFTLWVLAHIILCVTYSAALSLVPRSGGSHRRRGEPCP